LELVVRNVPFGTESRKTSNRASIQPATAIMVIARNAHAGSSSSKRKMSPKQALAWAALQAKCPNAMKCIDLSSLTIEERATRRKQMQAVRVSERQHAWMLSFLWPHAISCREHPHPNALLYNGYGALAGSDQGASTEEDRGESPSCCGRARWREDWWRR
jgi:hypothetical protein